MEHASARYATASFWSCLVHTSSRRIMGSEREEDPRVGAHDVCGVTTVGGTGIVWICIKKVHANLYQSRKGKAIYDQNPTADKHYFVVRYPSHPRSQP
jgi:hypothetical protein